MKGIRRFRNTVYDFYQHEGRRFPWRESASPWGVLVSEFMLQQTRTERVQTFYLRFIERWPTPQALAKVPLEEVLREWNGLGYNRRARLLRECAAAITDRAGGVVPSSPEELAAFPGIGPYSAGAIACFAYNVPSVFIETNIRSAVLYFFFQGRADVHDREIIPILEASLDKNDPRTWYYAIMDYGAAVKRLSGNPGRRSAGYKKQSAFTGSFRQLRGSVLRVILAKGGLSAAEISKAMDVRGGKETLTRVLETMKKDLLITEKNGVYRIRE